MAQFVKTASGVRREVVKDYQSRGDGIVIPSAFDDDFGGRPDLAHGTTLPPPIDDPTFETLLDEYERSDSNKQDTASASSQHNEGSSVKRVPFVPLPSSARPLHPPQETSVSTRADTEKSPIRGLVDEIMKDPNKLAQFLESNTGYGGPAAQENSQAARDSYVQVTMEGPFGRFRSKAADVIICENHIALLYTGGVGDDDLAYEPPSNVVVTLKIPLSDDNVRSVDVVHFGLTTKIPNVGTLVVLPKNNQSQEDDHHAHEEEYPV